MFNEDFFNQLVAPHDESDGKSRPFTILLARVQFRFKSLQYRECHRYEYEKHLFDYITRIAWLVKAVPVGSTLKYRPNMAV